MILYYSKGSCSLAIRILINELNIPCEYISVDLKTKTTEKGDDFQKINPKSYVPALITDDKQLLTENLLLHLYLADQYPHSILLPSIDHIEHYRIIEWLVFVSTELHKNFGPLFNPKISQELRDEIFIPKLISKFAYVNENLTHPYLTGNHFALPDGYLFVTLFWASRLKLDLSEFPQLQKYYEKLKNHPSIKKSLEQEGFN